MAVLSSCSWYIIVLVFARHQGPACRGPPGRGGWEGERQPKSEETDRDRPG